MYFLSQVDLSWNKLRQLKLTVAPTPTDLTRLERSKSLGVDLNDPTPTSRITQMVIAARLLANGTFALQVLCVQMRTSLALYSYFFHQIDHKQCRLDVWI